MADDRLAFYAALVRTFVRGEVPTSAFEREYLAAFKTEPADLPQPLFDVLEQLFTDVDAYSPDCAPGQETAFVISEERLRQQAAAALASLEQLLVTQRSHRRA